MEENVALDSNKQKQFVKSIKGIKKLIKKKATEPKVEKTSKPEGEDAKKKKRNFKDRGLVYLSHIPHGFYENQMTQYFKQFGKVTNVRVIKSKKTGNSKGCAFVEFGEPAVAQIVAETMNNYLMGKRLIKAEYVPPEKQRRHAMRKHWNSVNNPGNELRTKHKKAFNENKTEEQDVKKAKNILKNLAHTKKKLATLGIDYAFFNPVDIPEALSNKTETEEETNNKTKKSKQKKQEEKFVTEKNNGVDKVIKSKEKVKNDPRKKDNTKQNDQKKQKQQSLKGIGVKAPDNFIKVSQEDSDDDDSDGSLEFDSDEFEKAQEFDDEFDSEGSESESDDDGGSEEEDAESSEDEASASPIAIKGPFKNKLGKKVPSPQPMKTKAQKGSKSMADVKVTSVKKNNKQESKRKAPQKAEPAAKKQKFEKKGKNQNKVLKKKK